MGVPGCRSEYGCVLTFNVVFYMILSVFLSSYFKHTVATSITELRWKVHGILTVLSYFIVHAVLVTWKSTFFNLHWLHRYF